MTAMAGGSESGIRRYLPVDRLRFIASTVRNIFENNSNSPLAYPVQFGYHGKNAAKPGKLI
jgi:hypothetical protein